MSPLEVATRLAAATAAVRNVPCTCTGGVNRSDEHAKTELCGRCQALAFLLPDSDVPSLRLYAPPF